MNFRTYDHRISFIAFASLILILSYWSYKPLLASGFFSMHDDTQVSRVVVMGKALLNGQFPVRWVTDLGYGYGYPLFNFYGPLPYYVGGSLYALGMDSITSTKAMFILGIVLAGIFMYIVSSSLFDAPVGFVTAILYVYAPYHAVQIYVRGAVGEFWVLVFLPLLFYGMYQSVSGTKQPYATLFGGIGLSGIILSHTIFGYVSMIFLMVGLFLYCVYVFFQRAFTWHRITPVLYVLVIGLGLSAFFWLPAFAEKGFTSVSGQIGASADYRSHFICLRQLWDSSWGYGGSIPGCVDGMSFKIGKFHLTLSILALLLFVFKRKKDHSRQMIMIIILVVTFVSLFFTLSWSHFLWEIIPGFAYVQYPWRFLTIVIFGTSLLGGSSVYFLIKGRWRWFITLLLVPTIIIVYTKVFQPQYIYQKNPAEFENRESLRWQVSKISDEYLPPSVPRPQSAQNIITNRWKFFSNVDVETQLETDTYARYILTSARDVLVQINLAHFPGWRYLVNGKEVHPLIVSGVPHFILPTGRNVIELEFANTFIRALGNIISIATIIFLVVIYGKKAHA